MSSSLTSLQSQLNALRNAIRNTQANGIIDDMNHVVISANAAGDNPIIVSPGQKIAIYELMLWNGVGAQSLVLKDGQLVLLQQTNVPIGGGLFLGFAGNGRPHLTVSAGNPLNLNLTIGSQVDGFAKYKIES